MSTLAHHPSTFRATNATNTPMDRVTANNSTTTAIHSNRLETQSPNAHPPLHLGASRFAEARTLNQTRANELTQGYPTMTRRPTQGTRLVPSYSVRIGTCHSDTSSVDPHEAGDVGQKGQEEEIEELHTPGARELSVWNAYSRRVPLTLNDVLPSAALSPISGEESGKGKAAAYSLTASNPWYG